MSETVEDYYNNLSIDEKTASEVHDMHKPSKRVIHCWEYQQKKIISLHNTITDRERDILDCEEELQKEIERREAAEKALRFYADEAFNSIGVMSQVKDGYIRGESIESDWEWCGKNAIGGKTAREYFKSITKI